MNKTGYRALRKQDRLGVSTEPGAIQREQGHASSHGQPESPVRDCHHNTLFGSEMGAAKRLQTRPDALIVATSIPCHLRERPLQRLCRLARLVRDEEAVSSNHAIPTQGSCR
jgi:hypothetical protein